MTSVLRTPLTPIQTKQISYFIKLKHVLMYVYFAETPFSSLKIVDCNRFMFSYLFMAQCTCIGWFSLQRDRGVTWSISIEGIC